MRTVLNLWMRVALGIGALGLGAAAAGCSDATDRDGAADGLQIVVTTSILGDVVTGIVDGTGAEVEVVMPLGADPHEFSPSARQAESMADADLLVVNGAGFEAGMEDVIERAEEAGTPVFAFADQVELRPFGEAGDDHGDEGGDDGDEGGDDGEDHGDEGGDDPHIWTDPNNIASGLAPLEAALVDAGAPQDTVSDNRLAYQQELTDLDTEIRGLVATVPDDRRVLVTNHEVFGYFADHYGFEVVGTVIPSGTTLAEPSSGELEDLADVVREQDVPAIFGETTQSTRLAEALADTVGTDVEVVELHTESLGEPGSGAETYLGMMRTDAELIAGALDP